MYVTLKHVGINKIIFLIKKIMVPALRSGIAYLFFLEFFLQSKEIKPK